MKNKKNKGFIYIIKSILFLLDRKDWLLLGPLLGVMLASAILNAIGIAMVVPFIAVAASPALIHSNSLLNFIFIFGHFTSEYRFLFFLGILALGLLVVGNVFNILVSWFSAKVTYGLKYSWMNVFLRGYLAQNYEFFLNNRSSELSRTILREITQLTNIILSVFSLLANVLSIVAVLATLLLVNPLPALLIMIGVGVIYSIIFIFVRNLLKKSSFYSNQVGEKTFKIVEEVFTAIKDVKLLGKEDNYLKQFEKPTFLEQKYQALYQGINTMPRYLLEIFAFGGVILLVLYLLLAKHNLSDFLPMLGFFVVALYRIMPLTQSIFGQFSFILTGQHCVDTVRHDYQRLNIKEMDVKKKTSQVATMKSFHQLEFSNVFFKYTNSTQYAVTNLNLTIKAGSVLGFVGPSGAGKTTIIDILLGLLAPTQGQFLVNDALLTNEDQLKAWQALLGYVPQAIVLSHNTIAQNIAFGELPETIDFERVKRAAIFAQIHDYIDTLPDKYESLVGDRGVRLSGGQRQRIGIARALYRDPQVLILDEATNALDGLTEVEIMQNIHALAGKKTVIIIAHRLQTVMACDRLYYIDQGHLVAEGSYQELAEKHSNFKRLVEISEGNFTSASEKIIESSLVTSA